MDSNKNKDKLVSFINSTSNDLILQIASYNTNVLYLIKSQIIK